MNENINAKIVNDIKSKTSNPIKKSASEALGGRKTREHSREDAITAKEWHRLIQETYNIKKDETALECRMILVCCGRLGLRAGEITHLEQKWINWNEKKIQIPKYSNCTKGENQEVCGYCRNRAKDNLESNNLTQEEAVEAIIEHENLDSEEEIINKAQKLIQEVNVDLQDMIKQSWSPKTLSSARKIPFDFNPLLEIIIENFFDEFNSFNKSFATVHRRLDKVVEMSNIEKNIYPHALRATAASHQASRDISIYSLMSFMGWTDPATARVYIQSNEQKAANEIRSKN